MNEEELRFEVITTRHDKDIYKQGFQKGKLEQKKEELEFLKSDFDDEDMFERIEQLSKEINSHPEEKRNLHTTSGSDNKEIGGVEEDGN